MKMKLSILLSLLVLVGCSNQASFRAEENVTVAPISSQAASSLSLQTVSPPVTDTPGPVTDGASQPTAQISVAESSGYEAYADSKKSAADYLSTRLNGDAYTLYVYRDFSDAANHFTQKAKIDDGHADYVYDMNENWQEDPYTGDSAIQARVKTQGKSWGGWLFLNGYLPKGESVPRLSFGEVDGAGVDLTGALELTFMAKGDQGGEVVEFFTAGLGYDGETNRRVADFPDSSRKRSLGFITLTKEWTEYRINLANADLSSIGCGFGFVLSGNKSGDAISTFYLDDIRFSGPITSLQQAPRLIKSYETDTRKKKNQIYIQNAAFSYDNALAALAFISENRQAEAQTIVDAFVYAVENDRYQPDRVRNAYAYGDLRPFPGWESGARLPGWYQTDDRSYYEDRYQVGTNVGNTSFVALALLHYYRQFGGEQYLAMARTIMNWVLDHCYDGTPGFTAGYDGWPEGDGSAVYTYTYKSTEHNIDAYAVFTQLYALTGEKRYQDASESARTFLISMYDPAGGTFYSGTGNDGVTPNKENIVLDTHVWSLLALGKEAFAPYEEALSNAAAMQTEEGGYPFHANNTNGGWWPEGTAFTSLALREYGMHDKAKSALDAMMAIQLPGGGFPAATVPELTTGFYLFTGEPWVYSDIPHIAPAAWYVMAVNGFNPYDFQAD